MFSSLSFNSSTWTQSCWYCRGQTSNKNECPSGAVTTYPSGAPYFIPVICGVRVAQSSVFCVILCWSLCALFVLCLMPLYWLSFVLCHCIDCPLSYAIVLTVLCLMPLYWLSYFDRLVLMSSLISSHVFSKYTRSNSYKHADIVYNGTVTSMINYTLQII